MLQQAPDFFILNLSGTTGWAFPRQQSPGAESREDGVEAR
jgi:hypothetical protein